MAKRRRLEVPAPDAGQLETKSLGSRPVPPVAQVAGQAASQAAGEVALSEMAAARQDGRLAMSVPVSDIAVEHLVRDRVLADDEDMEALIQSIAAHGQRMPIDVMETGDGSGPRYGLISGWRRLAALAALHERTGEARYRSVLAVVRAPSDAGDAYVSMVEENEIRAGLSYYERARIASLAAEHGAFEHWDAAVDALFAAGSRAKRSKIRSFIHIHHALGDYLRFPAHLGERLGLQVAAALKAGKGAALMAALRETAQSPEEEASHLVAAMRDHTPAPMSSRQEIAPGILLDHKGRGSKQSIKLSGPGVTEELLFKIHALLRK